MRHCVFPLVVSLSLVLAACSSAPPRSGGSAAREGSQRTRAWAPPSGFPRFVDHSVGQEEVSVQAMGLVGVPYVWGGNSPSGGFDCSGLVVYVVSRAAGVSLPRTTAGMSQVGEPVEPDQIAPGDLIFFNTTGRSHSHVGIYVGNYRFVNAPSTGGTVRLDYVTNPYWAKRFDGIRRVASTARVDPMTRLAGTETPAAVPATAATALAGTTPRAVRRDPQPASPVSNGAESATVAAGNADEPATSPTPAAPAMATLAVAPAPRMMNPERSDDASRTAPAPADAAPPKALQDMFEPPPPTSELARQQSRAYSAQSPQAAPVRSPNPPAADQVDARGASNRMDVARTSSANDDPIARIAASAE